MGIVPSKNYVLADGSSLNAAQATVNPIRADGESLGVVVCKFTSGTSVMVQGSLDGITWVDLLDSAFTATGVKSVVLFPQMRANPTSFTGSVILFG